MATILIIEDDHNIRENTCELLEMEGYLVQSATNGKEGFEKSVQIVPDIIICDIRMPEMDGLALLGKLGKHPNLKTIPVILYTAKSEKKDIRAGMDLGAYDYIVKPSDLEDLLASIKRCLQGRKTVRRPFIP